LPTPQKMVTVLQNNIWDKNKAKKNSILCARKEKSVSAPPRKRPQIVKITF